LLSVVALFAAVPVEAAVKCVDAAGNVTYTDRVCPPNTTSENAGIQSSRLADAARAQQSAAGGRASQDADDDRYAEQRAALERVDEMLEAKRRELQSKCRSGDEEACSDVVCMEVMLGGPPEAGEYRACARAKGWQSTGTWAQSSELRTRRDDTDVHVVCLLNPEELTLGGQDVRIFRQLALRANHYPTGPHDRNRFFTNLLGGPDYATWQEAADVLCAAK
jgi:hypothetical protein